MTRRTFVWIVMAAFPLGWGSVDMTARGDVLEMHDGRRLHGEVTKTSFGYHIKMKFTELDFDASAVKAWVKDAPPVKQEEPAATLPESVLPSDPKPTATSDAATLPRQVSQKVSAASVAALLEQGRNALEARDYAAGRDAFSDALSVEADNPDALLGLGVAYMHLKDFVRARAPIERAAGSASANRVAILNMAFLQLTVNNPMRGVKSVMDYLRAHPEPLDEPMLNAMATLMVNTEERTKQQSLFQQAEQFYDQYNKKLEAARPGMKRWGTQWLEASQTDAKISTWRSKLREVARLSSMLPGISARIKSLRPELAKQLSLQSRGWDNTAEMVQQQLSAAQSEWTTTQTQLQQARPTPEECPPIPTELALVSLSETFPPGGEGANPPQLASAQGNTSASTPEEQTQTPPQQESSDPPTDTLMPKTDGPFAKLATRADQSTSSDPVGVSPTPRRVIARGPQAQESNKPIKVTQYAAAFPITTDLLVTSAVAVEGASSIRLQSSDGTSAPATVLRTSDGLALLRASGRKYTPLVIGGLFTGGAVECPALASVNIFEPVANSITGTAAPAGDAWKVRLSRHPRLPGAPILAGGKVIGVELAGRDSDIAQIPAANLDQLRALLGADLPNGLGQSPNPASVIVQVIATQEKEN